MVVGADEWWWGPAHRQVLPRNDDADGCREGFRELEEVRSDRLQEGDAQVM